jgi:excisionase family DNA binding protein
MTEVKMTTKQTIELAIDDLRTVFREEFESYFSKILDGQDYKDDDSSEFLTTSDAAKFLNVHPNTIYNWAKEGRIEKHSIGRKLHFRKSDLLNSLKSNTILGNLSDTKLETLSRLGRDA